MISIQKSRFITKRSERNESETFVSERSDGKIGFNAPRLAADKKRTSVLFWVQGLPWSLIPVIFGGGVALCALLFFGYYFFQPDIFSKEDGVVTQGTPIGDETSEIDQDEGESVIEEIEEESAAQIKEQKSFVVDAEICDAECSVYQAQPEALQYCQAVCGLPATEGAALDSGEGCDTMRGIQKDTCLKSKAVAEKNGELCEEIQDKGLRDSCRNRMAEEYFD